MNQNEFDEFERQLIATRKDMPTPEMNAWRQQPQTVRSKRRRFGFGGVLGLGLSGAGLGLAGTAASAAVVLVAVAVVPRIMPNPTPTANIVPPAVSASESARVTPSISATSLSTPVPTPTPSSRPTPTSVPPVATATPSSTPTPAPGVLLLGDKNVESYGDYNASGWAEGFQYAAPNSGTVHSVYVHLLSTSSKGSQGAPATTVTVGIYSDSNGRPGSLLASGSTSSPVVNAWNSITLSPVSLTGGSKYWVAVLGTGGALYFSDTASPSHACLDYESATGNLSALPSSWSSGAEYYNCPASVYAVS